MNKKTVILMILIVLIIQVPVEARKAPFTIQADDLVLDQPESKVRAKGQVKVDFENTTLLADELEIDLDKKEVFATGNVTFIKGEQQLQGPKLIYNYQTEKGKFLDGKGKMGRKKFAGEEIEIVSGDFKVKRATITSCKNPEAHYKLVARKMTIYPEDKLIARGVEVWLTGKHILTYPVYKISLEDDETRELTPVPTFGYNNDDGYYMELDYEHYINPDLEGDIDLKLTSRKKDKLRLDYDYDLNDQIDLNSIFDYDRDVGWYSRLKFDGDFDHGFNLDADLKYDRPRSQTGEIIGDVQLMQRLGRYYWQLERDHNKTRNYQHQLTLGTFDKRIANTELLTNARYRTADVYFEDNARELKREDFRVQLWSDDYEILPGTTLDLDTNLRKAWYETGEEYGAYKFGFDIEQELELLTDIELGFDSIHETGQAPALFDFEEITPNHSGLGWRRDYDLVFDGHWITFGADKMFKWKLNGHRAVYETGDIYDYYGYETKYRHFFSDNLMAFLDYEYRKDSGDLPPLSSDEVSAKNNFNTGLDYEREFAGGHWNIIGDVNYDLFQDEYTKAGLDLEYKTKKQDLAYWNVETNFEYDLLQEEYTQQDLKLERIYDCMEFVLSWDFLEQSGEFGYEMEY